MNFTVRAAQLFIIVLFVCACYVVGTRRIKMAWALELALMLLTFALVGALDAVISDRPFLDREAVAARWLLTGASAALVAGIFAWRLLRSKPPPDGRERRRDALVTLTKPVGLDPLARDFGDAPRERKQRPLWRWRRK